MRRPGHRQTFLAWVRVPWPARRSLASPSRASCLLGPARPQPFPPVHRRPARRCNDPAARACGCRRPAERPAPALWGRRAARPPRHARSQAPPASSHTPSAPQASNQGGGLPCARRSRHPTFADVKKRERKVDRGGAKAEAGDADAARQLLSLWFCYRPRVLSGAHARLGALTRL